jgi:hypothetical protein
MGVAEFAECAFRFCMEREKLGLERKYLHISTIWCTMRDRKTDAVNCCLAVQAPSAA